MIPLKTKRACREIGLLSVNDWICRARYPMRDATGTTVKGETFFAETETVEIVSRIQARWRGLKPAGRTVGAFCGGGHDGCMYRISDCVPRPQRRMKPPVEVDLLAAIFAVNRSAKRHRDAATVHYWGERHGLAGVNSRKKRTLYSLKEKGIVAAYRAARIECEGIHGRLAIYRGEGYCFHSPWVPVELELPLIGVDEPITVQAKPRRSGDTRLCDAEYTLDFLPNDTAGFKRLYLPDLGEYPSW